MSKDNGDSHQPPKSQSSEDAKRGSQPPSVISRIGASASSLARDAFSSAGAPSVTSGLAASLSSEKAQSSSSSSAARAAGAASSTWAQDGWSSAAQSAQSAARPTLVSFRSTPSVPTRMGRGSAWPSSVLDYDFPGDSTSWTDQFRALRNSYEEPRELERRVEAAVESRAAAASVNVPQGLQREDDGAEVVALLNDVSFSANEQSLEADLAVDRHMNDTTAMDLFGDEALSASEQEMARQMRAALPAESTSHSARSGQRTGDERLPRLIPESFVGVAPEERATGLENWLATWRVALDRYVEEVWGFEGQDVRMGQGYVDRSRVEAAREVIKETGRQNEWWKDDQAVRRLAMVLRHLDFSQDVADASLSDGRGGEEQASRDKGKSTARPTFDDGDADLKCPDCGGLYGTDAHLGVHQRWASERQVGANGPTRTRVEEELRRLQRELPWADAGDGQYGRRG